MKIEFTKMHGIGNDYIYINCLDEIPFNPERLAKEMSPRHFSVGGDGVVLICPSDKASAKMRMFNADGSEGKMCGNAIRCVGKYLYDRGLCNKTHMTIETLSGIKTLDLTVVNGKVTLVRVQMGKASLCPASLPALSDTPLISSPVKVDGELYDITALSVGNPHAVVFVEDTASLELSRLGPKFENLPLFPERVNTEFVKYINQTTLEMRVWERGSGETYACGTGACASVCAAVVNGICRADTEICVRLIGGELSVVCRGDMTLEMTGSADTVYEGVYEYAEN